MPKLNVITCGTSILSNGSSPEERKFLYASANKKEAEYTAEERAHLLAIVDRQRSKLLAPADEKTAKNLSAELNGFISYYREKDSITNAPKDQHFLICTDTWQGRITAGLISEWGNSQKIMMNIVPVEDLCTSSMTSFQFGMNNLVKWCEITLPGYRQSGYQVIFNLVGGFKALQGYMQTLGMFYADETVYIFESSKEILSIPRLPVDFSETTKTIIRDNLQLIRGLMAKTLKLKDCAPLPRAMLQVLDDECDLSPWGTLMFSRFQEELYGEKLLPPLLNGVQYSKSVENAATKLDPPKLVLANKAIDLLCRYLEDNSKNPASFDFRLLQGNPVPPSTHEFNLWSTQNGWRAFCHYENGKEKLLIDFIGPGVGH